jgi:hypothetical protein
MIAEAPQDAEIRSPDNRVNGSGAGLESSKNQRSKSNPLTKKERVLSYFLTGAKLNRFEAERIVNDHCLHSSVSTLQQNHGLVIDRVFETVPALQGRATARVCRYWIHPSPENLKRARAVLGIREEAAQ